MQKESSLDALLAESYRRSPLAAVVPYVILGLVLAGLFVWRVAVTDPDWDANADATAQVN